MSGCGHFVLSVHSAVHTILRKQNFILKAGYSPNVLDNIACIERIIAKEVIIIIVLCVASGVNMNFKLATLTIKVTIIDSVNI